MTIMRRHLHRIAAVVATGVLAASLTACNNGTDTTQPATTGAVEDDQNAELRELYNQVLDNNLDTDRFSSESAMLYDPTGEFEYSLVDINSDGVVEMMVRALSPSFNIIKVFAVHNGELVETDKLFADGASSAGGARAATHVDADHRGVLATSGQAGTGQFSTSRWELQGDEMVETQTWDYRSDQIPSDLEDAQTDIDWTSTEDRAPLDNFGETEDAPADDDRDGPNPTPPPSSDDSHGGDDDGDDTAAPAGGNLPQSDIASPDQTGTTCGPVDGVTVTAGSATSCGFAMNVAQQALQPGSWEPGVAPDPTVTAPWGRTTVTASSPTTGETYTLSCNSGTDHATASCTGGNNARVMFEKRAQGGLMYLVG